MIRTIVNRYVEAYAGLSREIWFLALVMFVNRSGTMVLPFLTLYLTSELDLSEGSAAQMITVYGAGSVVGTYVGGRLTQHFEAIRLQAAGMIATVPLMLVIPLWTAWWQFALSLFAMAVVYETVRPANATAVAQASDEGNRVRAFGLQRLAANLGFSFGPVIGGLLATYNFALLFVADALTMLLAAGLLVYLCLTTKKHEPQTDSSSDAPHESPLRNSKFLAFLGLILATEIVFMQFLSTYPLYLRDHFLLKKSQIGLIFAVNTSIIVLFEMVFVDSIKRWDPLKCLGWGSALCCLGFGMLPFGQSGYYCALAMVVLTIGEMAFLPIAAAYVVQFGPQGKEGVYMGWFTFVHAIAWVLGPFLGSLVYGYSREALWFCCLAVGAGVLAGYRLMESTEAPRQEPLPASAVNQRVQSTVVENE